MSEKSSSHPDLERRTPSPSVTQYGSPESTVQPPIDPNIIDWDGPDDPEKPINWPRSRKAGVIGTVCLLRFVTPLASSMMASGIVQIEHEFNTTTATFTTFTIIGFGLGPLVLAPLSEVYGRNTIYHVCNVLFTIFTAACSLSPNAEALFAFRLLAGIVGGVPLTNAGGTIADIVPVNRQGSIMTLFTLCLLVGPVLGPTAGGFLSQAAGWCWIFWLLTIMVGLKLTSTI
ncbi:uncharacterized protein BHQ10_003305 [Talaromyces amestolkiae]|uniref:Major facilitator superfamily (MFS) profile domain-containing protein n=1 Tax=Talaromyces amestolkiae TaxID=1196081 RepID=A0A364KUS8_TALAM|nr:uncharacterized protein BHQ10_003305 [Talaromyces amestolkiae]RAO67293.1 hypothetical protein BHQ10_003305 [Talaromyces amestolkiae]